MDTDDLTKSYRSEQPSVPQELQIQQGVAILDNKR